MGCLQSCLNLNLYKKSTIEPEEFVIQEDTKSTEAKQTKRTTNDQTYCPLENSDHSEKTDKDKKTSKVDYNQLNGKHKNLKRGIIVNEYPKQNYNKLENDDILKVTDENRENLYKNINNSEMYNSHCSLSELVDLSLFDTKQPQECQISPVKKVTLKNKSSEDEIEQVEDSMKKIKKILEGQEPFSTHNNAISPVNIVKKRQPKLRATNGSDELSKENDQAEPQEVQLNNQFTNNSDNSDDFFFNESHFEEGVKKIQVESIHSQEENKGNAVACACHMFRKDLMDDTTVYQPYMIPQWTQIPDQNRESLYTKHERVGTGGFSKVYKVSQDGKFQAMKIVSCRKTMGRNEFQTMTNEIMQCKRLQTTECIEDFYDIFYQGSKIFQITELCEGGDLYDFLCVVEETRDLLRKKAKNSHIPALATLSLADDSLNTRISSQDTSYQDRKEMQNIEERLRKVPKSIWTLVDNNTQGVGEEMTASIIRVILSQLKMLHKRKQVMKDLKLENIFINNDKLLRLGDLGLVSNIEVDQGCSATDELLQDGYCLGTKVQMASEQMSNYFHFKSDMWVVGIMAQQLMTGNVPINNRKFKTVTDSGVSYDQSRYIDAIEDGYIRDSLVSYGIDNEAVDFVHNLVKITFSDI